MNHPHDPVKPAEKLPDPKFYLVEAAALPEVFLKVAEVKRMLLTGEAEKVSDAARRVGISRSAFYKYKESIFPFHNMMAGRIITFQVLLQDTAGLLSGLLQVFSDAGANILTINQTIPTGGVASVTITAETIELVCPLDELLNRISHQSGVCKAEIMAG